MLFYHAPDVVIGGYRHERRFSGRFQEPVDEMQKTVVWAEIEYLGANTGDSCGAIEGEDSGLAANISELSVGRAWEEGAIVAAEELYGR